jgi:UDP:flavonoid glycosyltransferase YjiC (YdhE family)
MRILFAAFGSRGDVQPILALGKGLQQAGYEVVIAAGSNFQTWIEAAGFEYAPIGLDVQAMMTSGSGKQWIENSSDSSLKEAQNMRRMLEEHAAGMNKTLWDICQSADVLVSGLPLASFIDAVAEKTGKPHIYLALAPVAPTQDPAGTLVPARLQRSRLNLVAGNIGLYFLWWIFNRTANDFRRYLGLSALNFWQFRARWLRLPTILGASPLVVPPSQDWRATTYVTGYWFYEEGSAYQPPTALQQFLDAGTAPVYIGFGSMANNDPQATAQLLIAALQATRQRGIIYSGWGGLHAQQLPPNVYLLEGAPHDWLFPRMKAVVHHGGAGTTAAALRAGVPTTVVSHMGDQPYWGRRVAELGVGAKPIRRHELTVQTLSAAIQQMVSQPAMTVKAQALGAQIRQEDGVAQAVAAFQRLLG